MEGDQRNSHVNYLFINMCSNILNILVIFSFVFNIINCQDILETSGDLKECVIVPKECPNENITFWLYTRKTQDNPHQLKVDDLKTIEKAPFVKGAPFKVLIHGYTGHKDFAPNTQIRPALFQKGEFNVISVDYGPIAKAPCYVQAATRNIRVVGKCTAQLIDTLVSKASIKLKEFHVIGHSLGSQTAGFLADNLKSGKLSHITGLDPALPLFLTLRLGGKLDKSDAEFVDVLHTNPLARGKLEPSGHVDFYANMGSIQPGCEKEERVSYCSHERAPSYYAESINSKKGFLAKQLFCIKCDTQLMGYPVPPTARGIYTFKTNDKPPYALGEEGI